MSRQGAQQPPDRLPEVKKPPKYPALPQEIIDIIVNEIASQNLTSKTLKACSLVSKSFCFPCRRHLFSDIELVSDNQSQSRATRLVKILQNPGNIGLLASVRSLRLILDTSSSSRRTSPFLGSMTLGRGLHESKVTLLTLATRLRLYEDNFIKALNLLAQAPKLTSFTLHARGGEIPDWGSLAKAASVQVPLKTGVHTACSAPSLTTLCLSNLVNVDESLIASVIHSDTLRELVLTNLTLRVCEDASADPDLMLQPITNSRLERLDLRRVSYIQFLRTTGRPTLLDPMLRPVQYPFITFSRLRSLAVSGTRLGPEADALWQFMLGVANTLETLEIEEVRWQDPIQLGQLTSLRRLKLLSSVVGVHGNFDRQLRTTSRLLSKTAVSVGIESLTIQFNVQDPHPGFPTAQSILTWQELDDILTGSSFVHLRQVNLDFHFIFIVTTPPRAPAGQWPPQIDINVDRVLPRLSNHPSIDFQLTMQNIFTSHHMVVYLHFL